MGLLDGLATTIRFQSSRRTCEGAWAGPDAMAVGVVFMGNPSLTSGPEEGMPVLSASSGPGRTQRTRRGNWSDAVGRLRP